MKKNREQGFILLDVLFGLGLSLSILLCCSYFDFFITTLCRQNSIERDFIAKYYTHRSGNAYGMKSHETIAQKKEAIVTVNFFSEDKTKLMSDNFAVSFFSFPTAAPLIWRNAHENK